MSKTTIATLVVLVLLGVGGFLAFSNPFSFGSGAVETLAKSFMEDLQFKDFRSSSLYSHDQDKGRLDIGKTLESLFAVRPEFLDVLDYRIVRTEIDSSGERAKTVVKTRYKVLNKEKEPKEADVALYWMKRHPDCPMGGTCNTSGVCVNEQGRTIQKVKEGGEAKGGSRSDSLDPTADEASEASDEAYTCDPKLEKKWFMNLDSTLKRKEYRDPEKK